MGRDCPLYHHHGLDTGYAPRRHRRTGAIVYMYQCGGFDKARSDLFYASEELLQGQFLRHYFPGKDVTFLAWWDRAQGDTRGNCNSCFIVKGNHTTAEMLEAFPKRFPLQAACIERGGPDPEKRPRDVSEPYKLVEVFTTPVTVFVLRCPKCNRPIHETRYPQTEGIVSPHRAPDWQPSSPDYCKGSSAKVPWEPTERVE